MPIIWEINFGGSSNGSKNTIIKNLTLEKYKKT